LWMHNVQELLEHDHIRAVHCMCTINALCLDSLDTFLDQLIRLKQVYGQGSCELYPEYSKIS
jgi:hypothetical protein